jgi:hypothetical protein
MIASDLSVAYHSDPRLGETPRTLYGKVPKGRPRFNTIGTIVKSIRRISVAVLFCAACSSASSRIYQPHQTTEAQTPIVSAASSTPMTSASAPLSWSDTIRAAEVAGIRAADGKVVRKDGELRIQLLNGQSAIFQDDTALGETYTVYRYAGYLKSIHSHVVHRLPYEGSGLYIVLDDSTGDSTTVAGMPVPSPDGTRFALTSASGEADYDQSLIEVWRFNRRSPENEFSYDAGNDSWDPIDAVWKDSVTIDFTKRSRLESEHYAKTPARLIRKGTEWTISIP